jgi:hypothetical protein
MRPPNFLLKNHRIPHRDLLGTKRRRRTHISRRFATRGHGQNRAGSAETNKKKALDLSNFLWQAKLRGFGTTLRGIFPCYSAAFFDATLANVCPLLAS